MELRFIQTFTFPRFVNRQNVLPPKSPKEEGPVNGTAPR